MKRPENDRSRPADNGTASKLSGDDMSNVALATDPHCCAALSLDERHTAARFHIFCGVNRCARKVLRGECR